MTPLLDGPSDEAVGAEGQTHGDTVRPRQPHRERDRKDRERGRLSQVSNQTFFLSSRNQDSSGPESGRDFWSPGPLRDLPVAFDLTSEWRRTPLPGPPKVDAGGPRGTSIVLVVGSSWQTYVKEVPHRTDKILRNCY